MAAEEYVRVDFCGISDDLVMFLGAHGWEILAVQYDRTTIPPTPTYVMERCLGVNNAGRLAAMGGMKEP
jgi:hypothetical protein